MRVCGGSTKSHDSKGHLPIVLNVIFHPTKYPTNHAKVDTVFTGSCIHISNCEVQGPIIEPVKTAWNEKEESSSQTFMYWVVVSNIFILHPYLGQMSNLTNMFQRVYIGFQPIKLRGEVKSSFKSRLWNDFVLPKSFYTPELLATWYP